MAGSLADVVWAADSAKPDPKTFFPLVLSSDLAASPQGQRLVFALSHSTANGIKYASGPSVIVRFRKKGGQWSQAQKPAFDRAGLPKGRGVYVARPVLDSAGVWQVEARAQGQKVPYMFVVGKKEAADPKARLVSVRHRTAGDLGSGPLGPWKHKLARLSAERATSEGETQQNPGGAR